MTWLIGWWCMAAWAGPLEDATAWALLQAGEAAGARALAAEHLDEAPTMELAVVFLEASAAEGLARRGIAELGDRGLAADPAAKAAEALEAAVQRGDETGAVAAARALAKAWPDRPELLAPLWRLSSTPYLERARRRVGTAPAYSGLLEDLRWYRLDQAIGRATPDARLEAIAAVAPPMRPPLDDVGRHEAARAVFEGGAVPDDVPPFVQVDIAERAQGMWLAAGRADEAVRVWDGFERARHGALPALRRAEAAWAAGDREGARPPPQVLAWAVPGDRTVEGVARLRGLAAGWARAEARRQVAIDAPRAWGQLLVASALEGRIDEVLAKNVDAARRGMEVAPLEAMQRGVDTAADATALRDAVEQGVASLAAGIGAQGEVTARPEAWAEALVPLLDRAVVRAEALDAPAAVAHWGALRLAAAGDVGPHALALGKAHAALGQPEAAFAWLARARAEGAEVDAALSQVYRGPGEALGIADHLEGGPGTRAEARVVAQGGAQPSASRADRWGPAIGSRPTLRFESDAGLVDARSLAGRSVLLTFWRSDCEPCLAQLPEIAAEVRSIRASFRDLVVLAVSTDEDPEAYLAVARVADRWAQLYRDPELARTLGIRRVPTSVLLNPEGRVTAVFPHRLSPRTLRDAVVTDFD